MSMRQVLDLTQEYFADPARGFAAKMDALEPLVDGVVRSEVTFLPWAMKSDALRPTTRANVMIRPGGWRPNARYVGTNQRDAECDVVVGYETFHSDLAAIQTELTLAATVVAQLMDELPGYAMEIIGGVQRGTVYDVRDPMQFVFGQFEGATSSGFLATITLLERSLTD